MAKQVVKHTFTGGINTTLSEELLGSDEARYILNCNSLSTAAGDVGMITNVKGNSKIVNALPEGTNRVLGYASDEERNNLYYFVKNSNDYHTIYRYNSLEDKVVIVLQNLTDTEGVDILKFTDDFILHADVVRGSLLYWVQKGVKARKTNIDRCMDKSPSGYGTVIREEYISAHKPAPTTSPNATYFSDEAQPFNRLYGRLYKFASRFIYVDGEVSNWSDFGNVPLPDREPITGITSIPTINNGIKVSVETGSPDVRKIEIAMQSTDSSVSDDGTLNFATIAVLDKSELTISSDSTYEYSFYNDGSYTVTDVEKILRPYSYLPKNPLCQAFVKNAMVYMNFYEGFEKVTVDIGTSVAYEDLFVEDGVENEFNEPKFILTSHSVAYIRGSGSNRFTYETLLIGADVKKGNVFSLTVSSATGNNRISLSYTAKSLDTATTVANYFREKLLGWGKLSWKTNGIVKEVSQVSLDVDQNASFSYTVQASEYVLAHPSVQPVQVISLKDTGESINNIKLGSGLKFGIMYEDEHGRKSLVYTNAKLNIGFSSINSLGGLKKPVITLHIKHRPPLWATSYQVVRSKDLVYEDYIQMLIQKAIDVEASDNGEYIDMVVGSLYTYQKLHENTALNYEFAKGDRIRLISYFADPDENTSTYYPFYETEVLSFTDVVEEEFDAIMYTTQDTDIATPGDEANPDFIGRYIVFPDGMERQILEIVNSGTAYKVNAKMPEDKRHPSYKIVDRRGTLRIRKPPVDIIADVKDFSLVEVYKPSISNLNTISKTFYEFDMKFGIGNAGSETRFHMGMEQNQDGTSAITASATPAIIKIENGTTYVRNRELPVTNTVPGAQVLISPIEDQSFSDFYNSKFNDNGRINVEDTGDGEVHFGSRARFSNNFIENTRINGLNDFDNSDREDYNDKYGDIKRAFFNENRLFVFKDLKGCWVPVGQNILTQADGTPVVGLSSKLLGNIQYFAWEGGIGNNPESLAVSGSSIYHVSTNSGVVIRIGGDGVTPISETYNLDNETRNNLSEAAKYGAAIVGGTDPENGLYVFSIADYKKPVFFDSFNEQAWTLYDEEVPLNSVFEILDPPANGTVEFNNTTYQVIFTPDTGYVGTEHFTYRVNLNGEWSEPENVCIDVVEVTEEYAWRVKESSFFCLLDGEGNKTGYKGWTTLEQYGLIYGEANGVEKPNDPSDANYQAPVLDLVNCSEDVVLPEFDYLKITYAWTSAAGSDLDTFTGLIDTGTAYDNNWVGFGQGDPKVPTGAATPYVWWAGDNTIGGKETVLINYKQFLTENSIVGDIIKTRLNAVWYTGKLTGDVSVGITTYLGGTMSLDAPNFDFINTGGVVVTDTSVNLNVSLSSSSTNIANSQDIGTVEYNKTTLEAILILA